MHPPHSPDSNARLGTSYRPDLACCPHCLPDPTFSRLLPALRRLELLSSRPRASLWHGLQRAGACSMVLQFRCAAARPACLPPCHRMAACPTGTAPSPSPLPYPESQIARRQRSDRGEHNCMRAVHAGVTDYRLNAPEIAIGRPLLVENRPCEVCAAWSPLWKKKKSYLRRLVVHACCVPCASQGYHGDPHALENPWVCCLCAGCQKPKTPYSPLTEPRITVYTHPGAYMHPLRIRTHHSRKRTHPRIRTPACVYAPTCVYTPWGA